MKKFRRSQFCWGLLASWGLGSWLGGIPGAIAAAPVLPSIPAALKMPVGYSCPSDLNALMPLLLRDLPSYANRVTQRSLLPGRTVTLHHYLITAARAELEPLSLGPGAYQPLTPNQPNPSGLQQAFFTTLDRQYVGEKSVELQEYHWLFLTPNVPGWQLVFMFSRAGDYPKDEPPTPPKESSDGAIAQAVKLWLRDCQAGSIRP